MDSTFVKTVERALDAHGRQIVDTRRMIDQGLTALARGALDSDRRTTAIEQLVLAIARRHIQAQPDPTMELDQLRQLASDPLPAELEGADLALERLLGLLLKPVGPLREG